MGGRWVFGGTLSWLALYNRRSDSHVINSRDLAVSHDHTRPTIFLLSNYISICLQMFHSFPWTNRGRIPLSFYN
jgi:hypothetical protein